LNEVLCELFSPGFKGVGSNCEGTLGFVGFKELYQFCRVEETEEVIYKLEIVAVVLVEKLAQSVNIVFAGFALS
jgi:hypothetical protein